MALDGSGEMRLDAKAKLLRLFYHLDFTLFCQSFARLAARATERLHQSLGCECIGAFGLIVELGPLLVRAFVSLERVQREILRLLELSLRVDAGYEKTAVLACTADFRCCSECCAAARASATSRTGLLQAALPAPWLELL